MGRISDLSAATARTDDAEVASDVRDITPELAAILLENGSSRAGGGGAEDVDDYARQMSGGEWRVNGEAVVVSDAGRLLNGRKRLLACVKAGVPFRSLLVFGVPDEVAPTMDNRRIRKLSDILSIGGRPSHKIVATALRHVHAMRDGGWSPGKHPSPRQLLALLEANPGVGRSVALVRDFGIRSFIPVIAAAHFLVQHADREAADSFIRRLADPDELSKETPERILAMRLEGLRHEGVRITNRELAGMFVKAWNASRRGQPIRLLRLRDGEIFPGVRGLPHGWSLNLGDGRKRVTGDGDEDPRVELVLVTPRMASDMLSRNFRNRSVSADTVDKYARDLRKERWRMNGETLKIGRSGILLDGQHRLKACVKSGRGFWTLVAQGVDEATFDTLDLGGSHLYQDVLARRGMRNAARVAAGARLLWLMETGRMQASTPASHAELDDVMLRNPGLAQGAVVSLRLSRIMPPSVATVCYHVFSRAHAKAAQSFFDKLATGVGVTSADDPVHRLRERFLGIDKEETGRDDLRVKLALTIKAWNAVRAGRRISLLKWCPREEGFPEVAT